MLGRGPAVLQVDSDVGQHPNTMSTHRAPNARRYGKPESLPTTSTRPRACSAPDLAELILTRSAVEVRVDLILGGQEAPADGSQKQGNGDRCQSMHNHWIKEKGFS